jgi:predicted nucleic acid-binding protein
MAVSRRKFVLDTNCYINASRNDNEAQELEEFSAAFAPHMYLSSVVAAELRAGAGLGGKKLERELFRPFIRRDRVVTPSAASWTALGATLAALRDSEGLQLRAVPRGFILDILLAHSCREFGATLISGNTRDMRRIAGVFRFEFAQPYPATA